MSNGLLHSAFIGPGGPEMIVVMLVLLLLFGAKDAPKIFRKLNDIFNQFRSTAENFKREVMYSDFAQDEPKDHRTIGSYDDYEALVQDKQAVDSDNVKSTKALDTFTERDADDDSKTADEDKESDVPRV